MSDYNNGLRNVKETHISTLPKCHLLMHRKLDGPIYSLKLGGQTLVVLSSPDAVKDLLDKRSNIYSGRPAVFIRDFGEDLNILMRT
jgi:hypothetical protein